MSKFPCGVCSIGVKYSGIHCVGPCKQWFHSRCLSWPIKKFSKLSKEEIDTWTCTDCNHNCHNSIVEDLQEKILNLTEDNSLDHETSLSLAAEVGTALLTENNILKQKIHDLNTHKTKAHLELEDNLKVADEIISKLHEKTGLLQDEITFLQNKLKSENNLKDDLIQQSENEKSHFSSQIDNLLSTNSQLRNLISQLETELSNKNSVINSLTETKNSLLIDNNDLKAEINKQISIINEFELNFKEIAAKLSEQEATAKSYLQNLLKATKIQANPICGKLMSKYNQKSSVSPLPSEDFTELTNRLGKVQKEINCSQINGNKHTCSRNNIKRNYCSVSLQVAKNAKYQTQSGYANKQGHQKPSHVMRSTDMLREIIQPLTEKVSNNTIPLLTQRSPPSSAKLRKPDETIEEFFWHNIDEFKSSTNLSMDNAIQTTKGTKQYSNSPCTASTSDEPVVKPSINQNYFLDHNNKRKERGKNN